MKIDPDLLKKMRCPACNESNFTYIHKTDSYEFILCNSCKKEFYIKDNIIYLYLSDEKNNLWNEVYDIDIKGNFQNGVKDVYNNLNFKDDEKEIILTYFSLVGLIARLGMNFGYSLELGCGTGSYSLILKRFGYVKRAVLIDTSLSALKTAQSVFEKFGEDAYFIYANALYVPFSDKSFDLCLSGGLIEHFKNHDLERIIEEHCRVGRTVLCQFPTNSLSYWLQRWGITLLNGKWPFGYEKPIPYNDAIGLFDSEGLKLTSSTYHDFLTALFYRLSKKYGAFKPYAHKSYLNKLFKTDLIFFLEEK